MDWIHLAQDMVRWRAHVNMVMSLWVLKKVRSEDIILNVDSSEDHTHVNFL
jgi:hypothetical protein